MRVAVGCRGYALFLMIFRVDIKCTDIKYISGGSVN